MLAMSVSKTWTVLLVRYIALNHMIIMLIIVREVISNSQSYDFHVLCYTVELTFNNWVLLYGHFTSSCSWLEQPSDKIPTVLDPKSLWNHRFTKVSICTLLISTKQHKKAVILREVIGCYNANNISNTIVAYNFN